MCVCARRTSSLGANLELPAAGSSAGSGFTRLGLGSEPGGFPKFKFKLSESKPPPDSEDIRSVGIMIMFQVAAAAERVRVVHWQNRTFLPKTQLSPAIDI